MKQEAAPDKGQPPFDVSLVTERRYSALGAYRQASTPAPFSSKIFREVKASNAPMSESAAN